MGDEHGLELGGRDLVAADLDQLLEPVDEEDAPVLVDVAEVAGVQPAVGVDGRGRGVRVVAVARHQLRAAHPQLAVLARRQRRPAARVDDPGLGAAHEQAHRSRPHQRRVREAGQTATSGDASVMP